MSKSIFAIETDRIALVGSSNAAIRWVRQYIKESGRLHHARDRSLIAAARYTYRVSGMEDRLDGPDHSIVPILRAPHHTCSQRALVGSLDYGWQWRPGELSLALGGTLYLDDFVDFPSQAKSSLGDVLERNEIVIQGRAFPFIANVIVHLNRPKDEQALRFYLKRIPDYIDRFTRVELEGGDAC